MGDMDVELKVSSYGPVKIHWWPTSVPSLPINRLSTTPTVSTSDTIEHDDLSAQSISTYPVFDNGTRRDGDPIADAFLVRLFEEGACFALADGCGWGPRSFKAANNAIEGFTEHVEEEIGSFEDLREAASFLLSGMSKAHNKIWEPTKKFWEVGSTTLLTALLLKVENSVLLTLQGSESSSSDEESETTNGRAKEKTEKPKKAGADTEAAFILIVANIGDCKAFVIRGGANGEVIDATVESKTSVKEKCDPGGRLGPYLEGHPDTRNLLISTVPVYPGDTICIVSDGVHDNLDPETLGLPLSDSIERNPELAAKLLKLESNGQGVMPVIPEEYQNNKAWEAIAIEHGEILKTEYREKMLADFVAEGASTPALLIAKLFEHCQATTKASREFMELDPSKVHPPDYGTYPGKMDHTTAIIYRVPGTSPTKHPSSNKPHVIEPTVESLRWTEIKEQAARYKNSASASQRASSSISHPPHSIHTELPPRQQKHGAKSTHKSTSATENAETATSAPPASNHLSSKPSPDHTAELDKEHSNPASTSHVPSDDASKPNVETSSKKGRLSHSNSQDSHSQPQDMDELISSESSQPAM